MNTRKGHQNTKNKGFKGFLGSFAKSDDDDQTVNALRQLRDKNVERDIENRPSTSAKSADEIERSAERSGMAALGDSGGDNELVCAKCEKYEGEINGLHVTYAIYGIIRNVFT